MPETMINQAATTATKDAGCRVLFVCTGNTCRSPMAAAWLNDKAPQWGRAVFARSAGLFAVAGAPITPAAAAALRDAGVRPRPGNDYTVHAAHTVTREDMAAADEVIAISAKHAMELLMRFPESAMKIYTLDEDVPDPYGGSAEDYRACLAQLARLLTARFGEGAAT